jgi:ParB/RepB/Spo0J family partition protein
MPQLLSATMSANKDSAETSSEESVEGEAEVSPFDLDSLEAELIEVKDIPLTEIAELQNIRQSYTGIETLAETMHFNGQLQPCLVRPSKNSEEPYELIFGYRRKRAAELLASRDVDGWDKLRCEVRDVADGEELAQVIVENFQRENPSAAAEARAMQSLKDSLGLTNTEVAHRLGCDPSQVSHRLSLLKLAPAAPPVTPVSSAEAENTDSDAPAAPADSESTVSADQEQEGQQPEPEPQLDILEMVDEGKISASVAEVIVGLEQQEDREKLAKLAARNEWSVKRANSWAQAVKENVVDQGPDEMGEIAWVQLEDVVELPRLKVKEDLSPEEYNQLLLYSQLRNYMDREITDYIAEKFSIPYESLWDYVSALSPEEVQELSARMLRRYIGAAHRFPTMEPELRDNFGTVELYPVRQDDLELPAADDHLLAIDSLYDFNPGADDPEQE